MQNSRFGLLLTKDSFENLSNIPGIYHSRLENLLKGLIREIWMEKENLLFKAVRTWKEKEGMRYLFSCPTYDARHAIWEVVNTVDLWQFLQIDATSIEPDYKHFMRHHIVIHDHKSFPGDPEIHLVHNGRIYDLVGDIPPNIFDSEEQNFAEDLVWDQELYYLSPILIPSVLQGEQRALPMHMTGEQASVLGHRSEAGPLLLSGEAGSGKTTVITHWLVINHMESPTPQPVHQLFVTLSERLVKKTREEFQSLLPRSRSDHRVEFLTYRDLLMKKITGFGGLYQYDEENEVTFERFMREYSWRIRQKLDPVLVWDEIRSVIKGGAEEGRRIIDLPTYEILSEGRGHCKTPKELRKDYYEEAQRYQNYLDQEGLWDSIDLANRCLELLEKIAPTYYDRIACDEVQDLAPAEIRLLIHLVEDQDIKNIFFTGDIAQVINPSGFSWSRLKGVLGRFSRRQLRERDIRDAWSLEQNFRSSVEIVELVNEVLTTRNSILGRFEGGERKPQRAIRQTPQKPMILKESPLEVLDQLTSNPQERMILTKNKKMKNDLEERLVSAWKERKDSRQVTVLTVEEAKGLEWDGVLLWNFFEPRHEQISKNDWKQFFIPELREAFPDQIESGQKHPYGLSYEFNLLHVGLTRSRDLLFCYDESEEMHVSALSPRMEDLVAAAELDLFQKLWKTDPASAAEIHDLGNKLLEKDRDQAIQLFKEAAAKFEEKKDLQRAAEAYEKAGEFEFAADCHKARNDLVSMEKALALLHRTRREKEKEGDQWKRYAERCLKAERLTDALDGFERGRKAYESENIFEKAAKITEERAKHLSEQVRVVDALKDAARFWLDANQTQDAVRVLETMLQKGRSWKLDETEQAIGAVPPPVFFAEHYDLLGKLIDRAAEATKNKEKYGQAAKAAMEAAGMYSQAWKIAPSRHKKKEYRRSQIENIHAGVGRYLSAGENYLAIDLQNSLLNIIILEQEESDLIVSTSEKLFELLKSSEKKDELLKTTETLWNYFSSKRRREKKQKVDYKKLESLCDVCDILEANVDWFVHRKLRSMAQRVLKWLMGCYLEEEDSLGMATTAERTAVVLKELEAPDEAIEQYATASRYFVKTKRLQRANQALESAFLLEKEISSQASVGMFCLHDAALRRLLPEAIRRIDERRPWELIIDWIQKAVQALTSDFKDASDRLIGLADSTMDEIKGLTPPITRDEERALERQQFRLALIRLCMAFTIDTWLAKNLDKKSGKIARERDTAFLRAITHFEQYQTEVGPKLVLDIAKSRSSGI
ncbi:MAG: UvrD-helicase domain-containing protein [Candidatus Heimdallarchaeota archaeon]